MKLFLFSCLAILIVGCSTKKYDKPHILIVTNEGDIEAELYPDKAPQTVAAFLKFVDEDLYSPASFYRVQKNEGLPAEYNVGFIQGGINKTNPARQQALPGIPHESPRQTGLTHTNGVLSLARTTPGSGNSEFFICIGDQQQFDSSKLGNSDGQGYAAFGKVVKGMKVVRAIQSRKSVDDAFVNPILIKKIKRL